MQCVSTINHMKYFFILGTNPTLSVAETMSIFNATDYRFQLISKEILLMETKEEIDMKSAIRQMGGIIKIGLVEQSFPKIKLKEILESIFPLLKPEEGKFKFGLSFYGNIDLSIKPLGMEIKKHLKEKAISCRWVVSKEKALSSVVVEQNRLIGKGLEIVLIKGNNEFLLGRTLAVQPFKDLSARDYGRPARDDMSGMLPPKLAQIMINLGRKKSSQANFSELTLLDPFCGSGTILSEALLMGFDNLIGSDLSEKAVSDSKKNLDWIARKFSVVSKNLKISQIDVTRISQELQNESVDLIVTEPYLGPQRGKIDLHEVITELGSLYSKALAEFRRLLKKGGQVVIIFPIFLKYEVPSQQNAVKRRDEKTLERTSLKNSLKNAKGISPDLKGFKIVEPISEFFRNNQNIELTQRGTMVYGREGQRVWREIVILEKN